MPGILRSTAEVAYLWGSCVVNGAAFQMAGFRDQFFQAFSKVGNLAPSGLLLRMTRQHCILPLYHLVSDDNPPHVRHLYAVKTEKAFRRDLDFLLRLYEPVDYPLFREMVARDGQASKPVFLLTFDDGLREFHEVVAPILLEKGIPAVCFLNSGFIDNAGMFFRYKASLLLSHLAAHPGLLQEGAVKAFAAAHLRKGGDLPGFLHAVDYRDQAALDALAGLVGCDFTEFLSRHQPYLTTGQIQSCIRNGFHFGAHSIDHPEYRLLEYGEQVRQTRESVESVVARFQLDYRTFSFPFTDFGVEKRFFEQVRREQMAELTFGCAGQKRESIPGHFQRIPFEMGKRSAKEIYNTELLYFMVKSILGKNTVHRA
jgi:peptidoglycan/xylan/chitin deacetylase (PgdA/CDA1 family)